VLIPLRFCTTAKVREQWAAVGDGDTSRVALALTRARIMGQRYPFTCYGRFARCQIKKRSHPPARRAPACARNVRHWFRYYERAPHITFKSMPIIVEIACYWEQVAAEAGAIAVEQIKWRR